LLGLAVTLQNPIKAKLLLKLNSADAASQLATNLRQAPQRWLRLQDSDLLLCAQPPEVVQQGSTLELRFIVPENSARLLLQRIAKTGPGSAVAAQ
jgi:hypothetical protein